MHIKIPPRQWGHLGLGILLLSSPAVYADISGKVFQDFNGNGTFDTPLDTGLQGVTVTATDASGASATATTAANGTYSFPNSGPTASGKKVRVEFSGLPALTNNGTAAIGTGVQFVTANATNVNFAVSYAENFCQANPKMVTPRFMGSTAPGLENLVTFSYLNEGTAPQDRTGIATSSQVGALWGVAYSRSEKMVYTSAVLKTHVPLGAEGLDAIYKVDPFSGSANATPWLELTDDLGIAVSSVSANPQYLTNTARGLDALPQQDASAYVDAMKVGIGDIELSADEKTLYVVNVYDKKLYAIDIATKTKAADYTIPDPGCSNGQARPWALGQRMGEIYVGVTCDGSASGNPASLTDNSGIANLKSSVYHLSGGSFTQVLSVPLNYKREPPFHYTDNCKLIDHWKPWTDTLPSLCADGNVSYPSPLLSDIEFDDKGDMILGFTDRMGFQIGHKNWVQGDESALRSMYAAGDILKACQSGAGWGIEGTVAGCSSPDGLAINQTDTNGYHMSWGELEKAGEFYEGDYFHGDGSWDGTGLSYFPGHPEITIGGLAVVPGTGNVMSVVFDPVTGAENYGTGGVITLSNTTGKRTRNGYQLYLNTETENFTASKGVGLGDLEVLCDPPPLEVGNRVWRDTDEDGIQDADEAGIDDVDVVLTCGANTATAKTASGGQFLFSSASNATFLKSGESCTLTIANTQTPLAGLTTTLQNADSATDNNALTDVRDSDASPTGEITFTVGAVGENNHALDIGYKVGAAPTVHSIGNRVWIDTDNDGIADSGEDAVGAGVKLDLKDASGSVLDTTTTDANGRYLFSGLSAGEYKVCVNSDNFDANAVLESYTASTGKTPAPNADTDNTDGDDNGSDDTASGLCSDLVTLGTDEPTGETTVTGDDGDDGQGTPDANSNLTVDFGVVPPPAALQADLALTKTVNPASAKSGDTVVYTLTVGNDGPDDATGVQVTDNLPAGVTWVSDDGAGAYDKDSGVWMVGNVINGSTKALNITVTIN